MTGAKTAIFQTRGITLDFTRQSRNWDRRKYWQG